MTPLRYLLPGRLISTLVAIALVLAVACGGADSSQAAPIVRIPPSPSPNVSPMAPNAGAASETTETTPVWQQLAPLPFARSEVAVVALRGVIYVIGGLESSGRTTSRVEAYNPASDVWVEKAALPLALHHVGVAAVGGKILILGGFAPGFEPVDTVFEYDAETDTWRQRTSMPTARGALAAAVVGDMVYAIGGVTGLGEDNVASLEVYDPRTDSWKTRAPMPTPRDHLAVGTAGWKIFRRTPPIGT